MVVFQPASDRLFVLLAAGNLATTQAVVNHIQRDLDQEIASQASTGEDLRSCHYLFEAANYIGAVSVAVQEKHRAALQQAGTSAEATFILGGQIGTEPHGLFMVYPQGNAVMATPQTPYLQIGESKYGKPPLDNVGSTNLSLEDAARLCLISEVLTHRSNLTVGPPFELAIVPRNKHSVAHRVTFEAEAPELAAMIDTWSSAQREALHRLPSFVWEQNLDAA
ncbi:20S proteasome subunit A/B [Synechococcus sp. L2F]|uniref:20S proteasome subunit A/B n=1 Tax=Synechococcus sp. L2F TaxID=2823739 RepID=UPI0020CD2CE4|nr:20S proteasome subunit A/B [Synechococcus sp. L2F]